MNEWKECKLGDVAEIVGGGTPSTSVNEYWNGTIPWLTPRDLTGYNKTYISHGELNITEEGLRKSSTKLMPKGTVLLTSRAPIGYVAIAENEVCTNQGFKSLILNKKLGLNIFVYYWLRNNVDYLQSVGTGTTFAEISGSVLKGLDILLPPLPEQKAIAGVLSSLDDKIDLLHRQNKTLEAMAEVLFRQWFIEPCKDGLPEGWREGKIPDEFAFTMGQSPVGTSFNEDKIGVAMFQGNVDFGFRFPSERVYTTEPTRFAEPLDTLISVRAPVGEQNMALVKCCIGRGVAAFRYDANKDYYTYTYFKIRSLMTGIKQFNDEGTVFGSIGKADFEALDITIPPQALIEDYEMTAKPLNDKVIENCMQSRTLEKLRDTLLPKLMSGEVRVAV